MYQITKKNLIQGFLIACFFVLFNANVSKASYFENFESYNVGDFGSQSSDWDSNEFWITTAQAYSGTKSIVASTSSDNIEFGYPNTQWTSLNGSMYFSFYVKVTDRGCFIIHGDAVGNPDRNIINQCFDSTGISPNGGGASTYYLHDFSIWTEIKIIAYVATDKYNLYIDDVLAKENVDFLYTVTNINDIGFYTGAPPSYNFYVDDFYISPLEDVSLGGIEQSGYDYTLSSTEPDYNTVNSQTCTIGQQCNIWFSFNELAIGYDMYLIYYASSTVPSNAIAETTVTANSYWQNKITVPPVTTAGTVKYNTLLNALDYGWIVKTGISINWIESDYWENLIIERTGINTEEWCAEEVVCADVSTSTSDFFYGFECGAREMLCWAFAPTNNSKQYILNSVYSFESSFPFNLVFEFLHRASNIIENEATSTASIDIPFIDEEGDFYMLPVITTSTVPTALGTSYDIVMEGLRAFIWIMTAGLIIFIIIKIL